MSVSSHLHIAIREYDARIRTFVPTYEDMIRGTADGLRLLDRESPRIVEMGIGTGELAARCLQVRPDARLVGIDMDGEMLGMAAERLGEGITLLQGDFLAVSVPPCDAIVSCIALHHIKPEHKKDFYKKCVAALRPGGILISADCFPAEDPRGAALGREAWLSHMERTYSRREAEEHLASWAAEDFYIPLNMELRWLAEAGFRTEVIWRQNAFGIIAAFVE